MADICLQIKCREQRDYPPCLYNVVAALLIVDMHSEMKFKKIKGTMSSSLCFSILEGNASYEKCHESTFHR